MSRKRSAADMDRELAVQIRKNKGTDDEAAEVISKRLFKTYPSLDDDISKLGIKYLAELLISSIPEATDDNIFNYIVNLHNDGYDFRTKIVDVYPYLKSKYPTIEKRATIFNNPKD